MGLENFAGERPKPAGSSGSVLLLRTASDESRKRNQDFGGGEAISAAIKARKNAYPLKLDKMTSAKAVFLNDGHPILAHRLFVKWISGSGYSFPRKENFRCSALALQPDGKWITTGKSCDFCTFLGRDPRLVVLWAVADLRQRTDKKTGETRKVWVCRIEADNDTMRGSIFDGVDIAAERDKRVAQVKYAMFQSSRSGDEKALGCGDRWTFVQWVDPKDCEPYLKEIPDWDAAWPILPPDSVRYTIERHKQICDEHTKGDGYSHEGYAKLLGEAPKTAAAVSPAKPAETSGGVTAHGLENIASAPAHQEVTPTMEDLRDKNPSTQSASSGLSKPAAPPAAPPAAETEGFDPWGDDNL
jgi:hypothetical protein